jgi:FixJ family two-component response regulator
MTKEKSIASERGQTVFLVEDDKPVREALVDLLDSAGIAARSFSSAEEFLVEWRPKMAGCLVLDVRLPGMSGMELQTRLTGSEVDIPIIVMTAHGDIPMVRKALKAGAIEFLTKPFQDDELLEAVEQAFAVDRARRKQHSVAESIRARIRQLSEREREVIQLVTAGMTNPEIAEKLKLSVVTVKLYRGSAMQKMRANSLADLVKMWEKQ